MHMNNGWLVEALDGNYGAKSMSRNGFAPKYIVLHGTAGGNSAAGIDDWFTNGLDASGQPIQASSHVIIDQAGVVIQGINFNLAAWGNGLLTAGHAAYLPEDINPNLYTISIEHVKSHTDNSDQLTAAQQAASFDVQKTICDFYHIPFRAGDASGGIIRHADIDPVNRSGCPGPYPYAQLYAYGKQVKGNSYMDKAMQDTWNASSVSGLNYNSGIANAWKAEYRAGHQYGPALTGEYKSVDWNGHPIIVQEFPGARCEWQNGVANWIRR